MLLGWPTRRSAFCPGASSLVTLRFDAHPQTVAASRIPQTPFFNLAIICYSGATIAGTFIPITISKVDIDTSAITFVTACIVPICESVFSLYPD
jgi:hypothetical protein